MKICHVCNFECEDSAELCPVCGAYLTEPSQTEQEETEVIIDPVLLGSFEDVVSAEIFKDILIENKIAFSSDDSENSIKLTFGGGFSTCDIYVDKSQYEKADALYTEFLASESEFDGEFVDFEEEN